MNTTKVQIVTSSVLGKQNRQVKTKISVTISQQIQVAHSELQIIHSKLQIAHSKFKSPTANSNRSQQIKVAHSKFKFLTANYKF